MEIKVFKAVFKTYFSWSHPVGSDVVSPAIVDGWIHAVFDQHSKSVQRKVALMMFISFVHIGEANCGGTPLRQRGILTMEVQFCFVFKHCIEACVDGAWPGSIWQEKHDLIFDSLLFVYSVTPPTVLLNSASITSCQRDILVLWSQYIIT